MRKFAYIFFAIVLAFTLVMTVGMTGCKKKAPPAPTAPAPPPPPPMPQMIVTAVLAETSVGFNDICNMIIVVQNVGQGVAYNTTVYGRATPSGYLEMLNCNPPALPVAPAGFRFELGDLYPQNRKEIRITFRTPSQFQIGNLPGFNVGVNFTYDYVYQNVRQPEAPGGQLTFSMSGTGGILFFKSY
jgi:hypothetical protein